MNNFFLLLLCHWSDDHCFVGSFAGALKNRFLFTQLQLFSRIFSIHFFLNSISSFSLVRMLKNILKFAIYYPPKLHTHFQPQLASSTFIFDTSLFIYRIAVKKKKLLKLLLSSIERKRWQICEPTNSNKAHTVVVCALHIMRFICS